MSLKKYKSQGKAVEVPVNSKEENSSDFYWISSKNLASVHRDRRWAAFPYRIVSFFPKFSNHPEKKCLNAGLNTYRRHYRARRSYERAFRRVSAACQSPRSGTENICRIEKNKALRA